MGGDKADEGYCAWRGRGRENGERMSVHSSEWFPAADSTMSRMEGGMAHMTHEPLA